MKKRTRWLVPALAVLAALPAGLSAAPARKGAAAPAQRRAMLLQAAQKGPAAVPQLAAALSDENLAVRRTAVRLLAGLGAPARAALTGALGNTDFAVRRTALLAACDPLTAACLPSLEKAGTDAHPAIRALATRLLVALQPRTDVVTRLLEKARADESPEVRDIVSRALWPFHKDTVLIRDRKDWDHEVKVVQSIPLAKSGWRFKIDPTGQGHVQKWFDPKLDDSSWKQIEIESPWEKQGFDYDGVAWYRATFDLPARPDHNAVEIHFDAVDECTWLWVNGRYSGQHDFGTDAWDKPFAIDITQDVRWGQRNQISVRVHDSAYAGGIWKPVRIEVLK